MKFKIFVSSMIIILIALIILVAVCINKVNTTGGIIVNKCEETNLYVISNKHIIGLVYDCSNYKGNK